jgi:enamine deaminase RidA (YjgF/YER057c/UK114 family)
VSAEQRIKDLGLELPPVPKPVGNYVGGVRTGNLLFMSGVGPRKPDGSLIKGKLGDTMSVDEGYQAARVVALNMLANIRGQLGSLDKVKRVVKVLGMVNATPDFEDPPKVINGFSDVFVEVFGDAGRGGRSAVGMATLPFQMAVEVEMVLEVSD